MACGYGQYLVDKKKKPSTFCNADGKKCRSGGIRTRGLLVPNQTRYQTALHLEKRANRGTRTLDLRFTKPLLYRLSHVESAACGQKKRFFTESWVKSSLEARLRTRRVTGRNASLPAPLFAPQTFREEPKNPPNRA